jgi:hypothetical protein
MNPNLITCPACGGALVEVTRVLPGIGIVRFKRHRDRMWITAPDGQRVICVSGRGEKEFTAQP